MTQPMMMFRRSLLGLVLSALAATRGCGDQGDGPTGPRDEISIAAAANLAGVIDELTARFEARSGIRSIVSLGSTASLAHQIENGAPFDVFLAADTEHVDRLVERSLITAESRRVYARGVLVAWSASHKIRTPEDLASSRYRVIAVPKPEVAPYGQAAVEVLQALDLWPTIESRVVYAQNVAMAKQFAQSGNADAALTASSLIHPSVGTGTPAPLVISGDLHAPLDQALGIVAASSHQDAARAFAAFLLSDDMQTWLAGNGYRRVVAAR